MAPFRPRTLTPAPPRVGIDARLGAYRGGGIAKHVERLVAGLAGAAQRDGSAAAIARPAGYLGVAPVVIVHRRHGRPGGPTGDDLPRQAVRTPPHHRLEDWLLPLELAPLRLSLFHATDMVVPRLWRGRSVVTIHDLAFLERPELLTADALRYYRRAIRSCEVADRIITVSEHTRRQVLAHTRADPAKIAVVPNAVDPHFQPGAGGPGSPASALDALVLDRFSLSGRRYILFVGTVEPRKNVALLLDAFRRLLDEGRDLMLVLAGSDGWLSDSVYQRAADLGLDDRARFLGYVDDASLASLYRGAAVLAHPALDEGFGLTPAEAMASGTAVVVSDAGSLPEVVGDAGLYADPRDPAAWVRQLARVLDEPELMASLVTRGQARARRFTIEAMAGKTAQVYADALQIPRQAA